ncbi:MAG TPA: hypothetical protein VEA16_22455, partial [Vicinamibacterales bacterium]|nr:hypothetical protein [Vicinamibacterales bacterium]
YLLVPWTLLYLHRAAVGEMGRRTRAGLALSLAAIALIGGWHIFVWCVIFIGVFVAVDRRRWRFGASVALLVAGLTAMRVVPALMLYDAPPPRFVGSYQSLTMVAAALIGEPRRAVDGLNWWEYNAFVGWVGFIVIAAGLTAPLTRVWKEPVASLWVPSAMMLVLSVFDVYKWTLFQLPGFESERVASRLLVIALLGFALLACVQFNMWLTRRPLTRWRAAAVALAGLLMAAQLVAHTNSRRPRPDRGIGPPAMNVVSERQPETRYVAGLAAAGMLTAITAGVALRMLRR